jgi:hypothetical protein
LRFNLFGASPRFPAGFFFAAGSNRSRALNRWIGIVAWVFFGLAVLCLAAWPLMIWRGMNSGLPFGPATLETLPYPIGALVFWIVARGLKLSTDLPPRA